MATPVGWSYGPWRTQTSTSAAPYATVPAAQEISPGLSTGMVRNAFEAVEPSGSMVGTGVTGPDVAGRMTSDERSAYGMVSDPVGFGIGKAMDAVGLRDALSQTFGPAVGGLFSGIPGIAARQAVSSAVPGYGMATAALKTPGVIESLMQKLGLQPMDRSLIGPTAAEMQGLADTFGYGQPTPYGMDAPRGITGGVSVGPQGYGTTGPTNAAAPTVGNPDSPFGGSGSGGMGAGDAPGSEAGGPEGSGTSGPGTGGSSGGYEASGGVHKTRPGKPRWSVYGEGEASGEGETGIFVPESMKRKGQQGREAQVEAAMRKLLRELRG